MQTRRRCRHARAFPLGNLEAQFPRDCARLTTTKMREGARAHIHTLSRHKRVFEWARQRARASEMKVNKTCERILQAYVIVALNRES